MERPTTLADFAGECKPSGQHICYRYCPVCGSDEWKLYVSPDTGLWKCFAGRHNAGGKVDIGQAADAYTQGQELMDLLSGWQEPVTWDEIDLPPFEPLSKMARRYLRKRGIDEGLAKRLGLVEWEDRFRILFPFFDRAGSLIYWNSRRYSDHVGEGPKYYTADGKHPLYELRFQAKYTDGETRPMMEVVLVEGIFDALAVHQAGYHAVALGGKSLPKYLRQDLLTITQDCGMITVLLDSDALASALTIRNQLSDQRQVAIRVCPPGKDPGDMTPDEIKEIIG